MRPIVQRKHLTSNANHVLHAQYLSSFNVEAFRILALSKPLGKLQEKFDNGRKNNLLQYWVKEALKGFRFLLEIGKFRRIKRFWRVSEKGLKLVKTINFQSVVLIIGSLLIFGSLIGFRYEIYLL